MVDSLQSKMVPIHLHMKVVVLLNGHNFILTVMKGNKEHSEWPGTFAFANLFILLNQVILVPIRYLQFINSCFVLKQGFQAL